MLALRIKRKNVGENGAPGGTRTPDLLVRSQTLYPTELRAHSNEMHCEQFTVIASTISTLVQPWGPVIRDVRENLSTNRYLRLHQTMVTPRQTTAIPIQRFAVMRSPRKALAPKAPAA